MKYYAVIDTNVIVSYFLTRNLSSPIIRLVEAIRSGLLIPMYNQEIIDEYKDVLSRDKFNINPVDARALIDKIKQAGIDCDKSPVDYIFPDPDDAVFYEVTMSRSDSYLITGNLKHFPNSRRVVSPSDMMHIIEFGELQNGILSDIESIEYLTVSLEEINSIINEYRAQRAKSSSIR